MPCTLQEFYNGCVKQVGYKRQRLALDGHTIREEECERTIVVKAGMADGNILRFRGEGNE